MSSYVDIHMSAYMQGDWDIGMGAVRSTLLEKAIPKYVPLNVWCIKIYSQHFTLRGKEKRNTRTKIMITMGKAFLCKGLRGQQLNIYQCKMLREHQWVLGRDVNRNKEQNSVFLKWIVLFEPGSGFELLNLSSSIPLQIFIYAYFICCMSAHE